MSAGERERCVVMVEGRADPGGRSVAGLACSREPRRGMRRTIRSIPIRLVASVASRGQRGVIVIRVALRAHHRRVRASQWESGVVVIERRWDPATRRVAN